MLRLAAPFGEALLAIETTSAVLAADGPIHMRPELPDGLRVDGCSLHSISIDCQAGDVFSVVLCLALREGWTASYASGERLDAFEANGDGGRVAAVGMRDPEWLCTRFPLQVLEASKTANGASALTARFEVLRAARIDIQAAVAWTNHPATAPEADSPWFAVDLAMKF